ncbi:MAG TPA: hypothetical protein P5572_01570 [Phycisphaerae bacterium]|nr:hypothetical protein [Phycisphaerae bacterium]
MMKFFRKYNKHLLAVFMALLLVIWLGGSAIEDFMSSRNRNVVLGTAVSGKITEVDRALAEKETQLLNVLGARLGQPGVFNWQTWQDRLLMKPPKADERLNTIDWILLKREADKLGASVTPQQAQAMLTSMGVPSEAIRRVAVQSDVKPDLFYQAAASYFSVENLLKTYLWASRPPEPDLRRLARDVLETASIEAVVFPAASFADPDETFSAEQMQKQFDAYRSTRGTGGLNFGYYIDPKVKVQYIRIDPSKIEENLRGSERSYEREAYEYWQANRDRPQFRWTLAEVEEYKKAKEAEASSNGMADANSNGADADSNGPVMPKAGEAYTDFRQAREKALEAVRLQAAQAEAERIVSRISQVLREPWFAVERDSETGIKPAPDSVKSDGYYTKTVDDLPGNMRYPDGIEVKSLDWKTADELAEVEGFGQAGIVTQDQGIIRAPQLAFNVEGLAEAPEESHRDTSHFLSLWQTFDTPLQSMEGAIYLFRVVGVEEGHAPASLDAVADQVTADLRLQEGMKKARQAAENFVAEVGTQGLRDAIRADTELQAKITPDRGGYVEPPPFPRDATIRGMPSNTVQPFGEVTQEFIDTAFRLAAEGPKSELTVVDLPAEADVVAMHGLKLRPLYMEDYMARRTDLIGNIIRRQQSVLMAQWLNAKNIRERNQFEYSKRT